MNTKTIRQITIAVFGVCMGAMPVRAQWVKTSGPDSVRAFAYGILRPDAKGLMVFAGTTHGLFRSPDDGVTWTAINGNLTNLSIRGVVVLRDTLYAATGGGVFQSGNGGATWNAVNTGLTNLNVRTLYGYGTDLYAGTEGGGVFRSTNRGASWSAVGVGMPNTPVNALRIYSTGFSTDLYAATDSGVFRTATTSGGAWSAHNLGLANPKAYSLLWDASWLHVGTESGAYILQINTVPDPGWYAQSFQALSPPSVRALACPGPYTDGQVPKVAGTAESGIFFSPGSLGWSQINQGLTEMDVHAVGVWNQTLFAGTDGGVWVRPLTQVFTSVQMPGRDGAMDFRVMENGFVSFSLPTHAFVSLKVFNPQGKQIQALLEGELPAGSYERSYKIAAFPQGVYFYRLQAGAAMETRKVLLWR